MGGTESRVWSLSTSAGRARASACYAHASWTLSAVVVAPGVCRRVPFAIAVPVARMAPLSPLPGRCVMPALASRRPATGIGRPPVWRLGRPHVDPAPAEIVDRPPIDAASVEVPIPVARGAPGSRAIGSIRPIGPISRARLVLPTPGIAVTSRRCLQFVRMPLGLKYTARRYECALQRRGIVRRGFNRQSRRRATQDGESSQSSR